MPRLVDDRVVADVDALGVRDLRGLALGADVEADDDGIRRGGEVDVRLGDGADAAVDDVQRDLVVHLDLEQRLLQGLDRAGIVALEDEVEGVGLLQHLVQVLQGHALAVAGLQGVAAARVTAVGDLAGRAVLLDDEEVVAGAAHGGEAQDLDRSGRARLLDVVAELLAQAGRGA